MAILILFIIAFVVVITLYKKGILRKASPSNTEICDKTSVIGFSAVPKSLRVEFKLFEVRPDTYKDKEVSSLETKSDKIQQYVNEMVAMYNRREEMFTVDFINFNSCVGVVFKHWFSEEEDV